MEPELSGYAPASFTIKAAYNDDKDSQIAIELDPETKLNTAILPPAGGVQNLESPSQQPPPDLGYDNLHDLCIRLTAKFPSDLTFQSVEAVSKLLMTPLNAKLPFAFDIPADALREYPYLIPNYQNYPAILAP